VRRPRLPRRCAGTTTPPAPYSWLSGAVAGGTKWCVVHVTCTLPRMSVRKHALTCGNAWCAILGLNLTPPPGRMAPLPADIPLDQLRASRWRGPDVDSFGHVWPIIRLGNVLDPPGRRQESSPCPAGAASRTSPGSRRGAGRSATPAPTGCAATPRTPSPAARTPRRSSG